MSSSNLAALLLYHIVLGSFAIYILLTIWPTSLPISATRTVVLFGLLRVTLTDELTLLLLVVLAATVGAFVHSLGSLAYHRANRKLWDQWSAWYVMRPFIGVGLALILYFALRAGFLSIGADASEINIYGVAALSGIVGMFTARATEKLKDVADSLLKPVTSHSAAKPVTKPSSEPVTAPSTSPSGEVGDLRKPSGASAEVASPRIEGLPAEGEGPRPPPTTGGEPEIEAPAPVVGETRADLPPERAPAVEEKEAAGTPDRSSTSRPEPREELGEIREELDNLLELLRRLEKRVTESVPETKTEGED